MSVKGFIKSEMSEVIYKGVTYPCKELTNANGDTDCIATESLLEALGDDPDKWGDEERSIDEQMAYYFTDEEFNLSDDELAERLHDIGCMIAE